MTCINYFTDPWKNNEPLIWKQEQQQQKKTDQLKHKFLVYNEKQYKSKIKCLRNTCITVTIYLNLKYRPYLNSQGTHYSSIVYNRQFREENRVNSPVFKPRTY